MYEILGLNISWHFIDRWCVSGFEENFMDIYCCTCLDYGLWHLHIQAMIWFTTETPQKMFFFFTTLKYFHAGKYSCWYNVDVWNVIDWAELCFYVRSICFTAFFRKVIFISRCDISESQVLPIYLFNHKWFITCVGLFIFCLWLIFSFSSFSYQQTFNKSGKIYDILFKRLFFIQYVEVISYGTKQEW